MCPPPPKLGAWRRHGDGCPAEDAARGEDQAHSIVLEVTQSLVERGSHGSKPHRRAQSEAPTPSTAGRNERRGSAVPARRSQRPRPPQPNPDETPFPPTTWKRHPLPFIPTPARWERRPRLDDRRARSPTAQSRQGRRSHLPHSRGEAPSHTQRPGVSMAGANARHLPASPANLATQTP